MKNKLGTMFMAFGAGLLLSALLLLAHNQTESKRAGESAEEALEAVRSAITVRAAETGDETEAPEEPEAMAEANVGEYAYIGYLDIPALGLELPVLSQWDYGRLKRAPCRQFGTVEGDNLVVAGHNYTRHFGRLYRLRVGDILTFTDMEGAVSVYEVAVVDTLAPSEMGDVENPLWDLLLYTCTYGGQERVAVGCVRTEQESGA